MTECPFEHDILEAVVSGHWPEDLRRHADVCAVCVDLATVAGALRNEREEAWQDAHVPTSGQVWWRATMRTRAEAAATAARPIALLQGLAGACAAGLCAAIITLAWPSMLLPLAGIPDILVREAQRLGVAAVSEAAMQQALLSVVAVAGAGLILTPFVLYLVLSDD